MDGCAYFAFTVLHALCVMHSVQNRYLWERFQHEKQLMTSQLRVVGGDQDVTRRVNEQWLWHGSYRTNPRIICGSLDNIDFRMVRGHAPRQCLGVLLRIVTPHATRSAACHRPRC